MTVSQIYHAVPANLRKWNAFRREDRVEIAKVIFINTLAKIMNIDPELIHDNGKRYVIYAAN